MSWVVCVWQTGVQVNSSLLDCEIGQTHTHLSFSTCEDTPLHDALACLLSWTQPWLLHVHSEALSLSGVQTQHPHSKKRPCVFDHSRIKTSHSIITLQILMVSLYLLTVLLTNSISWYFNGAVSYCYQSTCGHILLFTLIVWEAMTCMCKQEASIISPGF